MLQEMDDALGSSDLGLAALRIIRRGKNSIHRLDDLFRQSTFGRLAGYEHVNDADQLSLAPVMRQAMVGAPLSCRQPWRLRCSGSR